MKILVLIARVVVGGLFIFSGLIKINDPVGTAIKLEEYFHVFSTDIAEFFLIFVPIALPLAVFLCVLEVVLGVAVLIWYRIRITSWVLLLLIIFFTFLTFYSAYFNKVTDCGCFGDAIVLTPWESFTKDIILLVLILLLFFQQKVFSPMFSTKIGDIIIVVFAVVNTILAVYAIQYLPYIDFRAYKIGADIPALMKPSAPLRYKYIMEKDGKMHEFESYPSDTSYHYESMEIVNPEDQAKISDYNIWSNEGDFTPESFNGAKLLIVIYNTEIAETDNIEEIKSLVNSLQGNVDSWIITASGEAVFEKFRHEHQLAVPYFFGDATVLKTIIRSNPGLVLLKDGVVKGKWHHNAVPEEAEIHELLAP